MRPQPIYRTERTGHRATSRFWSLLTVVVTLLVVAAVGLGATTITRPLSA